MTTTPTAFPVPGQNFIDRKGVKRGVTKVDVADDNTIIVDYLEGESETYLPVAEVPPGSSPMSDCPPVGATPERKPTCQYCLADPRYTPLGADKGKRCPVCGAAYSGPRRDAEHRALVEAGLVNNDD